MAYTNLSSYAFIPHETSLSIRVVSSDAELQNLTANTPNELVLVSSFITKDTETSEFKFSVTGYKWNVLSSGLSGRWEALEGSYNSKNVYFDQDFKATNSFGYYVVDTTKGYVNLELSGKSVYSFLMDALQRTKSGNPIKPTISLNASSGPTFTQEAGTTLTVPNLTATFNNGSYRRTGEGYGPDDTSISVITGNAKIWNDYDSRSITNPSTLNKTSTTFKMTNSTVTLTCNDSSQSIVFNVSAAYQGAVTPYNNLGELDKYLSAKIADGNCSNSLTVKLTGFRRCFWGYTTDNTYIKNIATEISSVNIRNISTFKSFATDGNYTGNQTLTFPKGLRQVIFAVPHKTANQTYKRIYARTNLQDFNFDNNNLSIDNVLSVTDYSGKNPIKYDFWYMEKTSWDVDTTLTVSWRA